MLVRIIGVISGLGRSCFSRGGWESLTGVVSRENGALERENMRVENSFMKFYSKEGQRSMVAGKECRVKGIFVCLFSFFLFMCF